MRYLINKAICHLVFFDKAQKEGIVDLDFETLYNGITSLYCLTETEKREILSYWNNEDFNELDSSEATRFHLEFLDKMTFKTGLFGGTETEKWVLRSKFEALEYYEKLLSGDSDLITAFERNIDRKQVSVSFSLLHYLSFGNVPDRLLAQLRKNATAKDLCDFDSLIFLLHIDIKNREQYKSILQKSSFRFYSSDYERITQTYFNEREAIENDRKISQ